MIPQNQEHIEAAMAENRAERKKLKESASPEEKERISQIEKAEDILTKAGVSYLSLFYVPESEKEKGDLLLTANNLVEMLEFDDSGQMTNKSFKKYTSLKTYLVEPFLSFILGGAEDKSKEEKELLFKEFTLYIALTIRKFLFQDE